MASGSSKSKDEIRRMMRITSAKMQSRGSEASATAAGAAGAAGAASAAGGTPVHASANIDSVVSHPFARLNSLKQLTCILCGCTVKSPLAWPAHLASKLHRVNAQSLRRQGQDRAVDILSGAGLKRRLAPAAEASANDDDGEEKSAKAAKPAEAAPESRESTAAAAAAAPLPEGFFDDPYADAKARHVPYKDKIEEELELFARQIRDTEHESEQIVEAAEEEAETVRRLDEIVAQEETWHRLNELELMKEAAAKKEAAEVKEEIKSDASDVSDGELDIGQDAFSWRKKQL